MEAAAEAGAIVIADPHETRPRRGGAARRARRRRPRRRDASCSCLATARRSIARRVEALIAAPSSPRGGRRARPSRDRDERAAALRRPTSSCRRSARTRSRATPRSPRLPARTSASPLSHRLRWMSTNPPTSSRSWPRSPHGPTRPRERVPCSRVSRYPSRERLLGSRPARHRGGAAGGDDLGAVLADAAQRVDGGLRDGDVLCVAHKVVSKAEGRVRALRLDRAWRARARAGRRVRQGRAPSAGRARRGGGGSARRRRAHHLPHTPRLRLRQRRSRPLEHGRRGQRRTAAAGPRRVRAGAARPAARAPRRGPSRRDHRLVRAAVADRSDGGRDRLRRLTAAGRLAWPRGLRRPLAVRHPHRDRRRGSRPPPTSSAARTRASPRCACAGSSATSPRTTAPAWPRWSATAPATSSDDVVAVSPDYPD